MATPTPNKTTSIIPSQNDVITNLSYLVYPTIYVLLKEFTLDSLYKVKLQLSTMEESLCYDGNVIIELVITIIM